MTGKVRVYIDSHPVDVEASLSAIDAVEAYDSAQAASVRRGEKALTDSRGLPAASDSALHNGAIFRIVRARAATSDDPDL